MGIMLGLIIAYLFSTQICGSSKEEEEAADNDILNKKLNWTFHVDETYGRMVAFLRKENGSVVRDCYISGDRFQIKNFLRKNPEATVTSMSKDNLKDLIEICTYGKRYGIFLGGDGEYVSQEYGIFSDMFIYPGTKWCGAGNISEGYDDLGEEVEADMCCRTHDYCNDSISGYDTKYGLPNSSPVTKSHCDCDEIFHNCLKEANTKASNRIGRIFFNFIQMECFREHYPIRGCKRYRGWFRRRCQEYEFDSEGKLLYQFFDAQHYEPKSGDEDDDDAEEEDSNDVFAYMLRSEKQDELHNSHKFL